MKYDNPHMSPHSPRMGNAISRGIGSFLLKLTGWKLTGRMPDVDKFIILGVPHTSNWDAISASLAMLASGFKYTFLIKKEWFFWPMGPLFRAIGGYPVDRGAGGKAVVEQLTQHFKETDKICISVLASRRKARAPSSKNIRQAFCASPMRPRFPCLSAPLMGLTNTSRLIVCFPSLGI